MRATEATTTRVSSPVVPPVELQTPVIIDFAEAATPRGEIARRLAAEARVQFGKLGAVGENRAGKLRTLSTGRADYFTLNPYLIAIKPGRNSRLMDDPANLQHIDDLARSIAVEGVKSPVTVSLEGDHVYLTDGHCRLFATLRAIEVYEAEIKSIPVVAESRFATEVDYVLRQALNGKPLAPLELGTAYVKMVNLGWSPQQIAEKTGRSKVRIDQVLDLMAGTTPTIRELVTSGKIAASTAALALREANEDAGLAEQALIAAVSTAAAAGKSRATPKHMAKTAPTEASPGNLKTTLRAILAAPSTTVVASIGADETVTITMSAKHWEAISRRLAG
jgi:ParB-like chromosome segregation protein Spo0J